MNKYLAGAIACSIVMALTACGGSSSSGNKTQSSAPASSAPASSSAVAVSTSAPAASSKPASSIATSVAVSSVDEGSSTAASSMQAVSSTAASSEQAASSSSVGSSMGASSSAASVTPLTGLFVDSVVAGVNYQTTPGNKSGVTSPSGEYEYVEGDTVIFSIGALEFPPVVAKGVVTPVDIAQANDPANADRIKTNIAALLQSLDTDGNPENGITIDTQAAAAVAAPVVFNQDYADFAATPAVTTLVANSGSVTTTLISEEDALAHLESSMGKVLVGTWYIETNNYKYLLVVRDDSHYAALDFDMESGGYAMETGMYEWNQETGVVLLSSVERTDSNLDARPPLVSGNTLKLDGNKITLTDDGEHFELNRLVGSDESPLQGGWSFEEEGMVIVFGFTGTHYFMGQSAGDDDNGEPGVEMGTYTYARETKAITVETVSASDTNGQWGLSHPCAVLNNGENPEYEESNYLACAPEGRDIVQTVEITGDTLTFISEADTINNGGEDDPFMMERANGLPDGDIHLKLMVTLTLPEGNYEQGQYFERILDSGMTASMQCDLDLDVENGFVEVLNESWVLGANPNRKTWVSTLPAVYNPETKKITFDIHEAVKPVLGAPGYFEEFWETLDVDYKEGEKTVISGTYTEKYDLTWIHDDSVSTCTATYNVTGVLR